MNSKKWFIPFFLNDLDISKYDEEQLKVATSIEEQMMEYFEKKVQKKARRLSISVKRRKPDKFSSDGGSAQKLKSEAATQESE